jgi:Cu/Ag efflux protein CusF
MMKEISQMNRHAFLALCASLILSATPALAAAAAEPLSDGVVKKLDLPAGKVTIAHGEIVNLKMPPMTMSFKARDTGHVEAVEGRRQDSLSCGRGQG